MQSTLDRYQFSVRSLLVVTGVVAFAMTAVQALGLNVFSTCFLVVVVSCLMVIGIGAKAEKRLIPFLKGVTANLICFSTTGLAFNYWTDWDAIVFSIMAAFAVVYAYAAVKNGNSPTKIIGVIALLPCVLMIVGAVMLTISSSCDIIQYWSDSLRRWIAMR